ncbi:MAG: 1-acyl-sn-glycerol-3-phosphate acyltransferase [Frankiales bacterium]|nr:1-acyl-sn-glycerol-3-phosphate acyltransferase [Frankiales bacterium]
MRGRRVTLREYGPYYAVAAFVLKPLCVLLTRKTWRGLEHVPAQGGVVLAANHISHADPIVLADFVVFGAGRLARFLAKSTLFQGWGPVARIMRGAQQIPVHRGTADAAQALEDAVAALQAGECVVVYPEGTVSRDPDKWPMQARTGVARLALMSGAPVVPIGQWGAERLLDSYRGNKVHVPATVQVVAGPPVDLSAFQGREHTAELLDAVTDEIMGAITAIVEELRGEKAPEGVHQRQAARSRHAPRPSTGGPGGGTDRHDQRRTA